MLLGPSELDAYGTLPVQRLSPDGSVTPLAGLGLLSLVGGYVEGDSLVAASGGSAYSDFVDSQPLGIVLAADSAGRISRSSDLSLARLGTNYTEGSIAPSGTDRASAVVYDSGVVILDRDARELARVPLSDATEETVGYRLVDARGPGGEVALRYVRIPEDATEFLELDRAGATLRRAPLWGDYLGSTRVGQQVYLYTDSLTYELPELTAFAYPDTLSSVEAAFTIHNAAFLRQSDNSLYEHLGEDQWRRLVQRNACPPSAIVVQPEGYYAQFGELITYSPDSVLVPPVSAHELTVEVVSMTATRDTTTRTGQDVVYEYTIVYDAILRNPRSDSLLAGGLRAGNFERAVSNRVEDRPGLQPFPALAAGEQVVVRDTVMTSILLFTGDTPRGVRFVVSVAEMNDRLVAQNCRTSVVARSMDPVVSVTEAGLTDLRMAPNPAHQTVSLTLAGGLASLTAFDLQGRCLAHVDAAGSSSFTWNHGLPSGAYTVLIRRARDGVTGVRRLIVE